MNLLLRVRESAAWRTIGDLSVVHWIITSVPAIGVGTVGLIAKMSWGRLAASVLAGFFATLFLVGLYHWEKFTKHRAGAAHPPDGFSAAIYTDEQIIQRQLAGITPKPVPPQHPDVILEWDPAQPWSHDTIRLRNIGTQSAFNILIGPFSWHEIYFDTPLEIQSLHPNDPELKIEPQYSEMRHSPNDVYIGSMSHILSRDRYENREPLKLTISYKNSSGDQFRRFCTFRRGPGGHFGRRIFLDLSPVECI